MIDVLFWGVIHGLYYFLLYLFEVEESYVMSMVLVVGLMVVFGFVFYNAVKFGVVVIMEILYHEMVCDGGVKLGVSVLCLGVV